MKKSLLALALSGAFALSAHAQSSVTLYGVIDTGIVYTNNQGGHANFQQSSSSTENTVYGLKGTEDLGNGLHAVFKLENGFNLNNGTSFNAGDDFGEQAYVGLQSDRFGSLLLGRQFDSVNDYLGPLSAAGNGYGGNLAASWSWQKRQDVQQSFANAASHATGALQAEANGNTAEAIRQWRIVFGSQFPMYG